MAQASKRLILFEAALSETWTIFTLTGGMLLFVVVSCGADALLFFRKHHAVVADDGAVQRCSFAFGGLRTERGAGEFLN